MKQKEKTAICTHLYDPWHWSNILQTSVTKPRHQAVQGLCPEFSLVTTTYTFPQTPHSWGAFKIQGREHTLFLIHGNERLPTNTLVGDGWAPKDGMSLAHLVSSSCFFLPPPICNLQSQLTLRILSHCLLPSPSFQPSASSQSYSLIIKTQTHCS